MNWYKTPTTVSPNAECGIHLCWSRTNDDGMCTVRACITKACIWDF